MVVTKSRGACLSGLRPAPEFSILRNQRTEKTMRRHLLKAILLAAALALASLAAAEPLPSWSEGQTKHAIVDFVQRVTMAGGPSLPLATRTATCR